MSENISEIIKNISSPKELLQVFETIKQHMITLKVATNQTDPVGQYAEYLVLKLYPNSQKTSDGTPGCDVVTFENKKIEVKGRVARTKGYIPKTYISDSNVSDESFDYLIYIVFDGNYDIKYAYGMSVDTFKEKAKLVNHNNSRPKWRFSAKYEYLNCKKVDNLTNCLTALQT